ncbi:hypothetical protein [Vibrio penaeicida]|uniref:Uncharacterized protein n=1 Tax=Vibrio penaeicida TaxID=104609 RepID=A0AAV5P0M0_9VIBR|nr:hypothetical protein [Vibrio penaeicida]RTZ23699.1 hypothetical protein EKN09_07520 [Vibrio penaeicida]GLQ76360.1 hypothetical protein GCM10007932_57230 [Vibrio penaeicida]
MKNLKLELDNADTRLVLEALLELENKWAKICNTSEDDDEVADYGNDLVELRLLMKPVVTQAVEIFGDSVVDFSRETL